MENHYKVELWIDEIAKTISDSNALKFKHNDSTLRIVNENYEEVFNCLLNGKTIRFANLEFTDNDFYKIMEEQQNNCSLNNIITLFSSLKSSEQNQKLDTFMQKNTKYRLEHSSFLYYISFGLLDYYDTDNRHTIASAPLVFLPIEITYNEEDKFFQIRRINQEIYLNQSLINYIRKSKKIDISYVLDDSFSLSEYLLFVASKVHMFHWSVNNGVFISDFDLDSQYYLEDLIEHQDKIANHNLVKAISYYNSEFYNFMKNSWTKLNQKLLSLLSLDNDEYRIMKRIANRESVLIRTNSFENKSHLLNNIILSFLLNEKKVLVVYDNEEQKNKIFDCLDNSLKPYVYDLNEMKSDKAALLNHLNQYENNTYVKDFLDPIKAQEVLTEYYDKKNSFKKLINVLRRKNEQFDFSLNECIEHYYRLDCPLMDKEITNITSFNVDTIEIFVEHINHFVQDLRKLKCYYKNHPFYGFSKKTMMQEEYIPLKNAVNSLSKDIKQFQKGIKRLNYKFSLPKCNNLKQAKAVLNILSIVPFYREHDAFWFESVSFSDLKNNMRVVEKNYSDFQDFKKKIIDEYGDKIFDLSDEMLSRVYDIKNLSRKETKKYKEYFKDDTAINLDLLIDVESKLNYLRQIENEYFKSRNQIDYSFNVFWQDGHYDTKIIDEAEEKVDIFNNANKYLYNNKLIYSAKELAKFKDENVFIPLSALRLRLQILFNRILKNSKILQEYFSPEMVDFSTLDFNSFGSKTIKMSNDFTTINDYLDFFVSHHKLNNLINGFADSLLKEEDYNLYELMFYKRFYHDYAKSILTGAHILNYTKEDLLSSIDTYKISEENRENAVDSILKNYYLNYIRMNSATLKKYEYDFINDEKTRKLIRPLSRITYLAYESIFHTIPCIFVPLKNVSKLLKNENYHYDATIFILNEDVKIKEVMPCIYRGNQIIAFDNEYLINKMIDSNAHQNDADSFIYSLKKSYEVIDFVSKTYDVLQLNANRVNVNFKNYLQSFLEKSGFKVARNVPFKNGMVDFLVKVDNNTPCTALIIDRLPYYSIESMMLSFETQNALLEDYYNCLRIFPFTFFLNEEKEKQIIIDKIIDNSKKKETQTHIVKKKVVDVLFPQYELPYRIYYQNKAKYNLDREKLFNVVLEKTAPISQKELLGIFPNDGLLFINQLLKNEKIIKKDDFIFVKGKDVIFRAYQNKEQIRNVTSLAHEEFESGINMIINVSENIEIDTLIKMLLLALGYKKMNAKTYKYVYDIIINMVQQKKITLHENILSLNVLEKEEKKSDNKVMLKRD